MEQQDERNPFQNYAGESTYEADLNNIESAFSRLDIVLAPGGDVVIHISNMKYQGRVTTLAWNVANLVSTIFEFDGEIIVTWTPENTDDDTDEPAFGYGYDHSYCLTYTKPTA